MTPDEIVRHIPHEVEEEAAIAAIFADSPEASPAHRLAVWSQLQDETKEKYRGIARAALAAGLAAWPGVLTDHGYFYEDATSSLILPLPQEPGK